MKIVPVHSSVFLSTVKPVQKAIGLHLTLLFFLLAPLTEARAQNAAQRFYKDTLLPALRVQRNRNFTVKVYDRFVGDSLLPPSEPQLSCFRHYCVSDKSMAFETDSAMIGFNRNLYYDKKRLRLTDSFEGYVVDGVEVPDSNRLPFDGFQFCFYQMVNHHETYYSMLLRSFMPQPYLWGFRQKSDTVVDGRKCYILRGTKADRFTVDTVTGERTPVVTKYVWFCDAHNAEIFRIDVAVSNPGLHKTILISDYSYDNRDAYVDSLFFANPDIGSMKHFDCSQSLPPSLIDMNEGTLAMGDSLFDHPIVSLDGDTTTLNQQQGWVLLDLWTIRCKPCMELPRALAREQEESGRRLMEQAGIKIMYVNATARPTGKMRQHVVQWGCEDVTYACEGLLSLMKESSVPQLYLISPDKQIVWHSDSFPSSQQIVDILRRSQP